ncbi:hypothetical protein VTK73DRAFT_6667 [Phialemonium thermophilum]|uniref:Uncharacterized protein n=1 Tax=Phialemonium thermophilum TaxID=223376 RepID=A0ABR3WIZ5_9PEZI
MMYLPSCRGSVIGLRSLHLERASCQKISRIPFEPQTRVRDSPTSFSGPLRPTRLPAWAIFSVSLQLVQTTTMCTSCFLRTHD